MENVLLLQFRTPTYSTSILSSLRLIHMPVFCEGEEQRKKYAKTKRNNKDIFLRKKKFIYIYMLIMILEENCISSKKSCVTKQTTKKYIRLLISDIHYHRYFINLQSFVLAIKTTVQCLCTYNVPQKSNDSGKKSHKLYPKDP